MKIGILGDTILSPDTKIDQSLLKKLQESDLNIANLESPFIKEVFKQHNKKPGLHQLEHHADQLKMLNVKAVSLANNHMFDFGEAGLFETIRILEAEGILFFGAGPNREEASMLKFFHVDNKTVAVGGYVSAYLYPHPATSRRPGTAVINEKRIIHALGKSNADIKLLSLHWNTEFEDYPDPYFLNMSKRLIGHCDAIIGAHPHCIQGIQAVHGKPVLHSIGNFTMPHRTYHMVSLGQFPDHCYQAFFVILHIDDGNNITIEKVPYHILDEGNHIAAMSDDEQVALESKIDNISAPLALDDTAYYTFYRNHKRRKFRPILGKSHIRNKFNIWFTFFVLKGIRGLSGFFARMLEMLGIRSFVRKRFAFILDRLFKL